MGATKSRIDLDSTFVSGEEVANHVADRPCLNAYATCDELGRGDIDEQELGNSSIDVELNQRAHFTRFNGKGAINCVKQKTPDDLKNMPKDQYFRSFRLVSKRLFGATNGKSTTDSNDTTNNKLNMPGGVTRSSLFHRSFKDLNVLKKLVQPATTSPIDGFAANPKSSSKPDNMTMRRLKSLSHSAIGKGQSSQQQQQAAAAVAAANRRSKIIAAHSDFIQDLDNTIHQNQQQQQQQSQPQPQPQQQHKYQKKQANIMHFDSFVAFAAPESVEDTQAHMQHLGEETRCVGCAYEEEFVESSEAPFPIFESNKWKSCKSLSKYEENMDGCVHHKQQPEQTGSMLDDEMLMPCDKDSSSSTLSSLSKENGEVSSEARNQNHNQQLDINNGGSSSMESQNEKASNENAKERDEVIDDLKRRIELLGKQLEESDQKDVKFLADLTEKVDNLTKIHMVNS